ncbi:sigma-54 interaction domain-containing protein [Wukongibacter sp. M2B1]|uniref:sigma-54 interaction domain-containing protein n=1 Tax=Wukongibacter sp. M2B1 TaxID=3088895 RepID=UPI003D7A0BB1
MIISSAMPEFNNLDPLMIDFMDIMNNYNKAIMIFERMTGHVYINDVSQNVFAYPIHNEIILSLLNTESNMKPQKAVHLRALNIKVDISYKHIKEKNQVKYTICTLDKVIPIHDEMIEHHVDETILNEMIGESPVITMLKKKIKKVARTDSTVLLMGETGTGKEMFAKTIHRVSPRNQSPFIAINCGAIPDSLIESELFGYEKGAFTGANQKGKLGKFEQASGGTVFLDEIENMSVLLQMKLLRVLEDRKVTRVGGVEEIPIDVRIIAATNYNLVEMIAKEEFRKDLYYRLNIVKLNIPNLKERHDDILLLSKHFIRIFCSKMRKEVLGLSKDVRDIFLNHPWEGNVRELRNTIEYAMNFEDSNYITKLNLPEQFMDESILFDREPTFKTIAEVEREYIERALNYFGWDDKGRIKAAEALGISRSSIYRKISK